jgi:hypothetical protein
MNPETVPLNTDELVAPVAVPTTMTKFVAAGTVNEKLPVPTVVPRPLMPVSPR